VPLRRRTSEHRLTEVGPRPLDLSALTSRKISVSFDSDDEDKEDEAENSDAERAATPMPEEKARTGRPRVLIVNYQLPMRLSPPSRNSEEGRQDWGITWDDSRSVISSLRVLRADMDVRYIGCPPIECSRDERESLEEALERENCVPVFVQHELRRQWFDGFCKLVLWPLFHYVMPQTKTDFGTTWDALWQAYLSVNMLFAKAVITQMQDDDYVWVQDYHLLLVPTFIRKGKPRARVGLFVHTPFPTSDVFRTLPLRDTILRGMLAADLVGFHTYDYARHFLSSCKRVLGIEHEIVRGGLITINYSGRVVSVRIDHVGIDTVKFAQVARSPSVHERVKRLREQLAGRRIIVSVDELDVVKGTIYKFQAYERLLSKFPEWRGRTVLLELIRPSKNSQQEKDMIRSQLTLQKERIEAQYGAGSIVVRALSPRALSPLPRASLTHARTHAPRR
jgi:trehalose 6-phosphate synthase/phosphatase